MNTKTFQHDGCDKFVSQVMTPISVYSELIVHASLTTWVRLISKKNLPKPVELYRQAIEEFLRSAWSNLDDYLP